MITGKSSNPQGCSSPPPHLGCVSQPHQLIHSREYPGNYNYRYSSSHFPETSSNDPCKKYLSTLISVLKQQRSKTAKLNRLRTIFRSFGGTAKHNNMAWRCSGSSNKELVENLFKNGLIASSTVRDAMMRVCPLPPLTSILQLLIKETGRPRPLLSRSIVCLRRLPSIYRPRSNDFSTAYARLGR
jgi:hypothetical protein